MNHVRNIVAVIVKKLLLPAAVAGAFFCFTAPPPLHAESPERCQRRVEKAERDLHHAIDRHGRHSRQADHERRELRDARDRCWRERQQWWDEHEHRWHRERDWDDRDHDRD